MGQVRFVSRLCRGDYLPGDEPRVSDTSEESIRRGKICKGPFSYYISHPRLRQAHAQLPRRGVQSWEWLQQELPATEAISRGYLLRNKSRDFVILLPVDVA